MEITRLFFPASQIKPQQQGQRQAYKRGKDMLDILDDIRMGILTGSVPKNRLKQLVQMVETRRESFLDPGLTEILDEIELRARVELAKLDNIT